MIAFINNNYFHGYAYSCGQKCLTLNTAESEYIAMVMCGTRLPALLARGANLRTRIHSGGGGVCVGSSVIGGIVRLRVRQLT